MSQIRVIEDATATPLPAPILKATSRTGQHEATLVLWSDDLEEIGVANGAAVQVGVWECEPGEFITTRDGYHELCQILSGSGTLTSNDGPVVQLRAGSTVVIPDGWHGVWTIAERIRKTYAIITTAPRLDADGTQP